MAACHALRGSGLVLFLPWTPSSRADRKKSLCVVIEAAIAIPASRLDWLGGVILLAAVCQRWREKGERGGGRVRMTCGAHFSSCKRLVSTSGSGQPTKSSKPSIYTSEGTNSTRFCKLGGQDL